MNKNNIWKGNFKEAMNNYKYLLMSWKYCFKKQIKTKRDMFKQNWQLIVLHNKKSDMEVKKITDKHNSNSELSNILTYIVAPVVCLLFGLWAACK